MSDFVVDLKYAFMWQAVFEISGFHSRQVDRSWSCMPEITAQCHCKYGLGLGVWIILLDIFPACC